VASRLRRIAPFSDPSNIQAFIGIVVRGLSGLSLEKQGVE
jgi:hypothetical protein